MLYSDIAVLCADSYKKDNCNIFNEVTSVAARVFVDSGVLYIIFRGSDQPEDWVYNLNPGSHTFRSPGGIPLQIHRGFYEQWSSVRATLLERVRFSLAEYVVEKIVVAGHSSGSALGTIAACVDLPRVAKSIPISCVTFGSPVVGDANFAIYFDAKITESRRFVHNNDPVPLLPLRYTHVASLVRLDDKVDKNNTENIHGADPTEMPWYARLMVLLKFLFTKDALKDHAIVKYVSVLEKYKM
jgi:pimeloyl-ACP methyl ester carboxylesterase